MKSKSVLFRVIKRNGGSPPVTYAQFNNVARMIGLPDRSVDVPFEAFKEVDMPVPANFDQKFALPPLEHFSKKNIFINKLD